MLVVRGGLVGGFPNGGIPAYEVSDEGSLITDRVRLWVRRNGPAHLVASYPLDEGTGTTLKDIGNGNNAALSTGAWATGAACHSGACVTMSGGDYAAATNTATISFGMTAFTATAWVKTTVGNGRARKSSWATIAAASPKGGSCRCRTAIRSSPRSGPARRTATSTSPSAANDGQWHFIAGVRLRRPAPRSTSTARRSPRAPSRRPTAPIRGTPSCRSAISTPAGRGFNGSLDDLRLYAGALTQTEVFALAQNQSCAARLGCEGATPNCVVTVGSPIYGQMMGTLPAADHSGLAGGALSFALSDNVTFSNNMIPDSVNPRSMSFWMKSTQESHACMVNYGIFSIGERFGASISGNNEYFVGEGADLPGVNEIDDGSWHHVLVTYDGTTLTLYRDGVVEASEDLSLNTGSSDVFIGMAVAGHEPEYYAGQLDDLRFYDHALSPSEVALVYSGDVSMKTTTSGLATWYQLNGDGSEEAGRCAP